MNGRNGGHEKAIPRRIGTFCLALSLLTLVAPGCSQATSGSPRALGIAEGTPVSPLCTPTVPRQPMAPPTATPAPGPPLSTSADANIGLDAAVKRAREVAGQYSVNGEVETYRACGPMTYDEAGRLWGPRLGGAPGDEDIRVYAVEVKGSFRSPPPRSAPGGTPPSPPPITRMAFIMMTDGTLIETRWGSDNNWYMSVVVGPPRPGQPTPRPVPTPTSIPA